MQFYPTNPTDNNAGITNIELRLNSTGEMKMFTIENEEIEDNSIVEFNMILLWKKVGDGYH